MSKCNNTTRKSEDCTEVSSKFERGWVELLPSKYEFGQLSIWDVLVLASNRYKHTYTASPACSMPPNVCPRVYCSTSSTVVIILQ